jgi:hypothetical protein
MEKKVLLLGFTNAGLLKIADLNQGEDTSIYANYKILEKKKHKSYHASGAIHNKDEKQRKIFGSEETGPPMDVVSDMNFWNHNFSLSELKQFELNDELKQKVILTDLRNCKGVRLSTWLYQPEDTSGLTQVIRFLKKYDEVDEIFLLTHMTLYVAICIKKY